MALTINVPSSTWLAPRPRSADPYTSGWFPSAYPPLPRRAIGNVFHEYLAGLWHAVNARGLNENMVVEEWVFNCPELDPQYRNSLTTEELMMAFMDTIETVKHADQNLLPPAAVQQEILVDFEQAMENDRMGIFPHQSNERITFETQHLFRSLCYVSYCFRSARLGEVLHFLFINRLPWIAHNNGRKSLWQWCQAIKESGMTDRMKTECISQLHLHRPDVFELGNTRGAERQIRELSHLVADLVDALRGGALLSSRRRPLHRGRSSSRPRPRDDDEYLPDRKQLRDDLRYHEREAERSRRKLATLDSDDDGRETRRPRSYQQRRSALQNAWGSGTLWSGSDDD